MGGANFVSLLSLSILWLVQELEYTVHARTIHRVNPTQTMPLPKSVKPQPSPRRTFDSHQLSFFLHGVLGGPQTTTPTALPFAKPVGILPPEDGIPAPDMTVGTIVTETPMDEGKDPIVGFEVGDVTMMEGEITEDRNVGSPVIGRAHGVYLASSEDNEGPMMALTVKFNGNGLDSLSFFGIHRTDGLVSHVPVISGTGKYENANGYASVRTARSADENHVDGTTTLLRFHVHLSH